MRAVRPTRKVASGKRNSVWSALAVGVMSLLSSMMVLAHPHGWIDMSIRVITDDQNNITGLHQTWRMDPFYSLVVFEELQHAGGDSLEAGLDQLGSEIRANLSHQHYFTEVRVDGERQPFADVTEYTALERNDRLTFMFILPLKTPQPLAGKTLEYQIFDPTYYIEMVHEEEGGSPTPEALVLNGALDCELRIVHANPDPELVMQAALLDVDEEAEPGLGRHFAETGRAICR